MNGAVKKENIIITNAYEHNLKNISVSIPLEKFTCVTGVSGCGKSSLVYDTIYAESQRNFLEGMSGNMYGQKLMDKPHVDKIENLRPALNVAQNYYNYNPRSTVGTLTDMSHFLQTIFALVIGNEMNKDYTESYFSANNPDSCCPKCRGLGEEYCISEDLVVPDYSKVLSKGAIVPLKGKKGSLEDKVLSAVSERYNIDLDKRFCDLSEKEKDILMYSENEDEYTISYKTPRGRYKKGTIIFKGVIPYLKEKLSDIETPSTFASISKYLTKTKCSCCNGTRLKPDILNNRICSYNIADVESMPMGELRGWLKTVLEKYHNSNMSRQLEQLTSQIDARAKK